jgi:hypothetical protein
MNKIQYNNSLSSNLNSIFRMKRILLLLITAFGLAAIATGQPATMLINQDVSGNYTNTTMTLKGAFFQARFQEATGQATGIRNWQFNSDGYGNSWGTITSQKTLSSFNTAIVPSAATASGNWVAAGYNAFGRLPATTTGYYYTYNILKGISYTSQNMAVLETSYNPANISTVTQSPAVPTNCQSAVVTINMSAAPNAAENVYIRYSTNGFTTSGISQATFSGATGTAIIPAQASGAVVSYYAFTSPVAIGSIGTDYDVLTLNLNNNSGSNYTYTVGTGTGAAITSAATGNWSNPATWVGGVVPNGCNDVTIAAGHTVTLDANANARTLTVAATGVMNVSANTLTVAITSQNNSTLSLSGTLNLTGTGNIVLNGNFITVSGASFNQSGTSNLTIDGNNNNVVGTSVASGVHTFGIASGTLVNCTSGTIMIVDPPVSSYTTGGTTNAMNIALATAATYFTGTHTFVLGDGISTTVGNTDGFGIEMYASGFAPINHLIVNGGNATGRWAGANNRTGLYGTYIKGDLTINSGSEFRQLLAAATNLVIAGNIVNNGTLTLLGTLNLANPTSATGSAITTAQTISGTGVFRNLISAQTANFTALTINNTSAGGVTFANANSLLSGTNTGTVSTTLTFTAGRVNIGANEFVMGVSALSQLTTLTVTAGGIVHTAGGKVSRWVTAALATVGTTATQWPILSATTGDSRSFFVGRTTTAPTTGGKISVSYAEATGVTAITSFTETSVFNQRANNGWTVTSTGVAGGTYTIRGTVDNMFTAAGAPTPAALTLSTATGVFGVAGTFPPTTPVAPTVAVNALNRTVAVALTVLTGSAIYPCSASAANPLTQPKVSNVAAGNWNTPGSWLPTGVPVAGDVVTILNGHNITVNATAAVAQTLTVAQGGTLTMVTGGALDIGVNTLCTRVFTVNGTLAMSGGTINHYGNVVVNSTATYTQTGGTFNVDGNASNSPTVQNTLNSVATGTHIFLLATSNLTLSGGTLVIVDPHAATATTNNAFQYTGGSLFNNTIGWTLKFGNGVSNDYCGDATNGFKIAMTNKMYFDNFILDCGTTGTNRFFNNTGVTLGINNFTITSGEYKHNSGTYIKSSFTNNGIFSHLVGTLFFADFQSGVTAAATAPCTISGSGVFRNLAASPTASFGAITINNTSATGVSINVNNLTMSGGLTLTAGRLNLGANTFSMGASTTVVTGTLSPATASTGNGIVMSAGGKFRRWYGTTTLLTTASTASGFFPLIKPSNGDIRGVWLQRGAASFAAAGYIEAEYVDASGTTDISLGVDAMVDVNRRTNSYWRFTAGGGLDVAAANLNMRIQADNIGTISSPGDVRLVGTPALLTGTNGISLGTGAAPIIERTGMGNADLTDIHYGVDATGNSPLTPPITSIATGDWNNPATWNCMGCIPTAADAVVIAATHNVTLNTNGSAASLTIAATGTLTANANTLDIGPLGGGGRSMSVSGTIALGGGTINHNGNLVMNVGSTLNMTAGNFNVDGNNGVSAAGSVGSGTNIVRFNTANLTFGGGTFTVVDPHYGASSTDYALGYNVATTNVNIPITGTTFKFGDGASTHRGGNFNGFYNNIFIGSGRLSFE